jgi:hypothetical protein
VDGWHQRHRWKNPNGYWGLGGTGISCPIEIFTEDRSTN